ncbi:NADH-quinone oxidoreductase subunit N [Nocardia halotolerans]|uniref:NADH-quinone oxidoreductase subunit N n=1 Tax=Nocardia halotolerans TaxID=1755878 RepID=A0ABV8VJN6_9NOCA
MSDDMMVADLLALAPEAALAVAAVVGLLLGSFLPRAGQWPVRVLAAAGAVTTIAMTVRVWQRDAHTLFDGSYGIDTATNTVRITVALSILLLLAMSQPETRSHPRESEFVVLLVLGGLGAVLLAGANDLLVLLTGYLLASIPLYALTAFGKDARGTEAALKYYLMGALFGAVMLFGATLILGVGGGTAYPLLATTTHDAPRVVLAIGAIAVLSGLLFKAGAVPVHFWVPDVTQGARPAVAAVITTVPKLGAVVAIYRLCDIVLEPSGLNWRLLIAIVAALSMTLGNFAAFFQADVRRLLGYSTISQVGYLLVGVIAADRSTLAMPAVLLYLAAYALTNLGVFAVVCALPRSRTISDYTGLIRRRPALVIALVVCLLGLVGTPPTGIFVGKLMVFTAAFDAGFAWLVVLALLNTVASVFYYLRWIVPAVSGKDSGTAQAHDGRESPGSLAVCRVVACSAAAGSILIGVFAGPILNAMQG